MTNPFAQATAAVATPAAETAAPAAVATPPAAPAPAALGDTGFGDPFSDPTGVAGDGERITEFVGNLLLVKPTEFITQMGTSQGPTDVVRIDMAVLDDAEAPGRIVRGVLLFQQALRREAKAVLDGPHPFLLGRLNKGKTNGGNTLYTFETATDADKALARQFLAAPGVEKL